MSQTLLFIEVQTPAEDRTHRHLVCTCNIMSIKCGENYIIYLLQICIEYRICIINRSFLQCRSVKNLQDLPCVTVFVLLTLRCSAPCGMFQSSIISILNSDHCSNVPEPSSSVLRDLLTGVQSVFVHLNGAIPLGMPSFHGWRVSKGCQFNIKSNDQRY